MNKRRVALLRRLKRLNLKLANANGAKYLLGLNVKKLNEGKRPTDADPKVYYQELQEKAKTGPIFSARTLAFVEALELDLDKQELQWVGTNHEVLTSTRRTEDGVQAAQDYLRSRLRFILDYFRAEHPNLHGLTFADADAASMEWHEELARKKPADDANYKTDNVLLEVGGLRWVVVPLEDLKTEGDQMGHCVGSGGYYEGVRDGSTQILSLRDKKNEPHVTVEVTYNKVVQIQGKGNDEPVAKYHPAIEALISKQKFPLSSVTIPYVTDEKVLLKVVSDGYADACEELASSKKLPLKVIEALAEHGNKYVRSRVARNPITPVEVLDKLVGLGDAEVDANLARNPNLTEKHLTQLAASKSATVRSFVAINPKTPPELIEPILDSMGDNFNSLNRILSKAPIPEDVLLARINDYNVDQLFILASNRHLPVKACMILAKNESRDLRNTVAVNTGLQPEVALYLAKNERVHDVRASLADNPKCCAKALELLAEDSYSDSWTKRSLIGNAATPMPLRLKLLLKGDGRAQAVIANGTNAPEELINALAMRSDVKPDCLLDLVINHERKLSVESLRHIIKVNHVNKRNNIVQLCGAELDRRGESDE